MLLFWSCKSPGICNLLPTTSTDQALSVVVVTVVVTTCTQFSESLPYWIISNNRFTHPPRHPPKKKWITLHLGHLKGFSFSAKDRFFAWADFVPASWLLSYRSFLRTSHRGFGGPFPLWQVICFMILAGKKSFWKLSWGLLINHIWKITSSWHVEVHFASTAKARFSSWWFQPI